ncbi:hypothetical protein D3C77_483740 [compost metagenome]
MLCRLPRRVISVSPCSTATPMRPRPCCATGWRCSPIVSMSKYSVPTAQATKSTCMRQWRLPTSWVRRWSRPTMCASSSSRTTTPTRPVCASVKVVPWMTRGVRVTTATSSTSKARTKWPSCSATCPMRWQTPSKSPSAATSRFNWASTSCRTSPRQTAWASTTTCGMCPTKAWKSAWRCSGRKRPRPTMKKNARSTSTA